MTPQREAIPETTPQELTVAYNEELAQRIRELLVAEEHHGIERSMFGGLAFMVRGHMTVGIAGDDLMVRVGPEAYDDALDSPGARPMDFTGRPMTGYVFVSAAELDDAALQSWVQRGLAFTGTLPPK